MQCMQYNIYFRKDNWAKFKKEDNKSQLINELLDSHYGQQRVETNPLLKINHLPPAVLKPKESPYGVGMIADAETHRVTSVDQLVGEIESAQHLALKPTSKDPPTNPKPEYDFCKHDNVKGFCKHGCK